MKVQKRSGKKIKGAPKALAKPADVNQLMQGIEEAVQTKKGKPQITRIRDASGPGGSLK